MRSPEDRRWLGHGRQDRQRDEHLFRPDRRRDCAALDEALPFRRWPGLPASGNATYTQPVGRDDQYIAGFEVVTSPRPANAPRSASAATTDRRCRRRDPTPYDIAGQASASTDAKYRRRDPPDQLSPLAPGSFRAIQFGPQAPTPHTLLDLACRASAATTVLAALPRTRRRRRCDRHRIAARALSWQSRLPWLDRPPGVLRVQLARSLGLGPLGPAVELAAGEDHLVDLVGAVGEAQHAAEAPEGGEGGVVGHAE